MMNWINIGTFLGRAVKTSAITSGTTARLSYDIYPSLVLVYICSILKDKGVESLLENLIKLEPMAIVLAGVNADLAFDYLLHTLSCYPTKKHIMTKLCESQEISEVAEDFLSATWPAEERFDEWNAYSILVVGCDDLRCFDLTVELQKLID